MTLKLVYIVQKDLYLYSTNNFFSFLMWDITDIPIQKQCPCCVLWDYEAKLTNTPHEVKQTLHRGQGSFLILFVITRTQQCKYCPLGAQRGIHNFKTRLYG